MVSGSGGLADEGLGVGILSTKLPRRNENSILLVRCPILVRTVMKHDRGFLDRSQMLMMASALSSWSCWLMQTISRKTILRERQSKGVKQKVTKPKTRPWFPSSP